LIVELKAIDTVYNGYRFRSLNFPVPPRKKMSARSNLAGRRFGRCVAVECLGVTETGGLRWWGCVCDCGTSFAVRSRELLEGDTRNCGCLQREKAATQGGHNKLPAGHAARNGLLASYKKSAKLRDIEWGQEDETFFTLVSSPCTYCHTPPDSLRKPNKGVNGGFMYSGIDRADNRLGYLAGNVVPCCWNCTQAKGTYL
jgi:hypothetical protein